MAQPNRLNGVIRSGIVRLAACVLFTLGISAQLNAASLDWPDETYPYLAVEQSISDALHDLGRNMGESVLISESIDGMIRGRVPDGSALDFLEFVAHTYGLIWYFDGAVLEIVPKSEMRSVVVLLKSVSPSRLMEALKEMHVWDDRFFFSSNQDLKMVHVSGPPRYVDIVSQVAEKLEDTLPRTVKVLRGGERDIREVTSNLNLRSALSGGNVKSLD